MFIVLSLLFCVVLVAADQFFKYLIVEFVKPIEYIDVIDGFLRFRYVENTGAVFGSFSTHTVLLTFFSIALLIFTVIYLIKNKNNSKLINFCLLLMVSGGIGNIIDRIRLQYVVDYIEPVFVNFAVFNFADCLITVGAFVLIIYFIIDLIKDVKSNKAKDYDEENTDKPKRRRRIRKAEVEGDKEAAVFNAVITGESADAVLNEIELGVDTWKEPGSDDTAAADFAEVKSLEDKKSEEASVTDNKTPENNIEESKQNKESSPRSNKISINSLDDIDFKSLK